MTDSSRALPAPRQTETEQVDIGLVLAVVAIAIHAAGAAADCEQRKLVGVDRERLLRSESLAGAERESVARRVGEQWGHGRGRRRRGLVVVAGAPREIRHPVLDAG